MKKARKALLTLCAALLLVSMTVGATVAYLTSTTEVVTNTFTVGSVAITLDEAKVDVYGVEASPEVRVKTNTYKLVPGQSYAKDPTVHVTVGSEQCYLFVDVTNDIAAIEADTTIAAQMTTNGWTLLSGNTYYYNNSVDAREEAKDVVVFESFTLKGDANVAAYNNATVTVKAYAVQAAGFENATAAWNATFGAPAGN